MTESMRNNGNPWNPRIKLVLIGFALIGGFFLVAEHRAHLIPYLAWLPWLFLLACPLMHVFMHHGHGDHDQHRGREGADGRTNATPEPGSGARQGPGSTGSGGTAHHHHGEQRS